MNLNYYDVFLDVAESHSITETAQRLNYTQSGVSHIVAELEKKLGVTLLLRRKQGVSLTPEGMQLLPAMREVVNRNERLFQQAARLQGREEGFVRVGSFLSVAVHWLPQIIKEFQKECPGIQVILRDGLYQEVEKWLTGGEIDCGFITRSAQRELDFLPLTTEPLLAVFPEGHPLAKQEEVSLADLALLPFIIPGEGSNYDIGRLQSSLNIRLNPRFSVSDDYAAIAMVRNGLGVTILPRLILSQNCQGVCVRPLENNFSRTIGLATCCQDTASIACKTFMACAERWVRAQ